MPFNRIINNKECARGATGYNQSIIEHIFNSFITCATRNHRKYETILLFLNIRY